MKKMTRINKLILILLVVICVIQIMFIAFYFINKERKTIVATDIFHSNINSVVELKCESAGYSASYGTAIIYDTKGYFITNSHIVTKQLGDELIEYINYFVRFVFEEDYRQVELVSYDSKLDLAILKLIDMPKYNLIPIKFGSTEDLKSGNKVYAIGNSLNQGISISQGIVGSPLVNIAYLNVLKTVIQSDIVITNGNSGGALLDEKGLLIGITTFRINDDNDVVVYGVAFSIPINIVKDFISERR